MMAYSVDTYWAAATALVASSKLSTVSMILRNDQPFKGLVAHTAQSAQQRQTERRIELEDGGTPVGAQGKNQQPKHPKDPKDSQDEARENVTFFS